jgi:LmbE family N-acetylglucosaminyl deacetylase
MLQVCAHPDDDLFFMNPDIANALRDGATVTTVFLRSGEADGRNGPNAKVDFEGYVAARYHGIRGAYAAMAGLDRATPWQRTAHKLQAGPEVEIATLPGVPGLSLVFFNLRNETVEEFASSLRLRNLWNGAVPYMHSLVPIGSPVGSRHEFRRDTLIDALDELYERTGTTLLRILDPDPQVERLNPSGETSFFDHLDHMYSSFFALAALERHAERLPDRSIVLESFRGYYNRVWPHNLSPEGWQRKKAFLDIYGGADGYRPADGCRGGDLVVGAHAERAGYGQSTILRYPGDGSWLHLGVDKRPVAITARPRALATETAPGAGESDTEDVRLLPSELLLTPHVAVVRDSAGRLHAAAMRIGLNPTFSEQVRELVVSSESAPGAGFTEWTRLGTAHDTRRDTTIRRHAMGMPALAEDGSGQLHLFAANFGKGLSSRVRGADGEWGPWLDLHGSGLQGGLSAVTRPSGRAYVVGVTATGFLCWGQEDAGAQFASTRQANDLEWVPCGPPALAVRAEDDVMVLVCREAWSGRMRAMVSSPGGFWRPGSVDLGAPLGFGASSVVISPSTGLVSIAVRNDWGTASVLRDWDPDGSVPRWEVLGDPLVHSPALRHTEDGRLLLGTIGPDGQTHVVEL